MGGYKEVPVQKMPGLTRGQYKTYKVVPNKAQVAKKEARDTMTKPVSVPMNHLMGMTFLASKNKEKLVNKLTSDASEALQAYVDVLEVSEDAAPLPNLEMAPIQVSN